MAQPYRLLSFDGGGIRGFISSAVLAQLDTDTGGDLMSKVDGVCGTSTGGIISCGLAAGLDPAAVHALYSPENAARIFTRNETFETLRQHPDKLVHIVEGLSDKLFEKIGFLKKFKFPGNKGEEDSFSFSELALLLRTKYTSEGLKELLQEQLGDKTLGDARLDLAVNTARLFNEDVKPVRWTAATPCSAEMESPYKATSLVDLACATGAAPVFFPPHKIGSFGYFADGGLFANNPVLNALEAFRTAGRINSIDQAEVISLGTGLSAEGIPTDTTGDPEHWGAAAWLFPVSFRGRPPVPLMSALSDLSASSIDEVSRGLMDKRLVRIQPDLPQPIVLDDFSPEAYKAMNTAIDEAISSNEYKSAVDMVNAWGTATA